MRRAGLSRISRLLLVGGAAILASGAAGMVADEVARPVMPGVASTRDGVEIRMAFSPDGRRRLWGRIDKGGVRGFEIYESVMSRRSWSPARAVSFNSSANDFDPFFARDGRTVLFFSNRPGGLGGDDIWQVSFDARTGRYGAPENLGAPVNTSRDEWAPSLSNDGTELLFSSDGHGGEGGQDLFVSRRAGAGWMVPVNLGRGVNGPKDDFDAAVVNGDTLIYTSGDAKNGPIALYRAARARGVFSGRDRLSTPFNCSPGFNLGPSWNPRQPGLLYFSASCPEVGVGAVDIFVARLSPAR